MLFRQEIAYYDKIAECQNRQLSLEETACQLHERRGGGSRIHRFPCLVTRCFPLLRQPSCIELLAHCPLMRAKDQRVLRPAAGLLQGQLAEL